ncbi:MAG: terpene cyclase/mutase family protein [Firmicutes bacterium]|nr:terpene cyclase/mutase family protein [Bacillota bacterium]MDY5857215.1 prenyltransferase/squalene oxidase repeat-containing protein [Anaerovoracaceae bacterium]
MKKKIISILLITVLTLTMIFGASGFAAAASQSKISEAFKNCGDYIYETITEPIYGSIGGEWVMYGLAQAGYPMSDEYVEKYQASVEKAVKEGYRGVPGQLHDRKYTEYSRVIAAYAALGLDPTDIAGYNMVEKLADFDSVVWQGINGPIWALRALDAGDYDIPEVSGIENVTTRQKLINYILSYQLDDGGWNLYYSESSDTAENARQKAQLKGDPDLTGMAMTALAPYRSQTKVKAAIGKAVKCLSAMQNSDGGYTAWGASSSESIAQVICGLTSAGINPNTDSRFKINGKSLIDALLSFYDEKTGGFRHVNTASGGYEPVVNQMATEQAYYALAAYRNTVPDKTTISKVVKSSSTSVKVTWKKAASSSTCTGYQVVLATNSGFTRNVKKVTVSGRSTVSRKVTELSKGKTYYVKVRAYKTVNGVKVYGLYSSAVKVKL